MAAEPPDEPKVPVAVRDWVPLLLAIGLATALNLITAMALWEAIFKTGQAGLSENATQILTTAFGGIIGVIGSYLGFRSGAAQQQHRSSSPSAAPAAPRPEAAPVDD